jgi:hypothetical protein
MKKYEDILDFYDWDEKDKKYDFLTSGEIRKIYKSVQEDYKDEVDFEHHFYQMDGQSIIMFLENVYENLTKPQIIDCSQTLIFVAGNLDEAYTMSGNFNPDISADKFHETSKEITISDIKQVLKKRFRSEQIARLGNNHIIYPAFSSKDYRQIISKQLDQSRKIIREHIDVGVTFHSNLQEAIYREGVFPTQGTRPVYSTIHSFVESRIGDILYQVMAHQLSPDQITFKHENQYLVIEYWKENQCIHVFTNKTERSLDQLRENKKDDTQAISAVHESGHAIAMALLFRVLPFSVHSITAESETSGFTALNLKWEYMAKHELVDRVAVYLAGLAAERVIFGDDHITVGAEEDLREATKLAAHCIRKNGMGNTNSSIAPEDLMSQFLAFDPSKQTNEEITAIMDQGMKKAEDTLRHNKFLLLKIADYLSDHQKINQEQMKHFVVEYASYKLDENFFISDRNHLFYRQSLKDKLQSMEQQKAPAYTGRRFEPVRLNREG